MGFNSGFYGLNCLVESEDTAELTIIDNVYETDSEPSKVISLLNKTM